MRKQQQQLQLDMKKKANAILFASKTFVRLRLLLQ